MLPAFVEVAVPTTVAGALAIGRVAARAKGTERCVVRFVDAAGEWRTVVAIL